MRIVLFLLIWVLTYTLGFGLATAGEKIWVGLYLAENKPPPQDATLAPEKLHQRLHDVFGFKHYELLQGQDVELRKQWEQWFLPRKDLFLRLLPLAPRPGEPREIEYEIYKDGFLVAKGKYQPEEDTPLFVNGPDYHQGRLIFVLEER